MLGSLFGAIGSIFNGKAQQDAAYIQAAGRELSAKMDMLSTEVQIGDMVKQRGDFIRAYNEASGQSAVDIGSSGLLGDSTSFQEMALQGYSELNFTLGRQDLGIETTRIGQHAAWMTARAEADAMRKGGDAAMTSGIISGIGQVAGGVSDYLTKRSETKAKAAAAERERRERLGLPPAAVAPASGGGAARMSSIVSDVAKGMSNITRFRR